MSIVESTDISDLMAVRRLLEMDKDQAKVRSGKSANKRSALDYMKEDQALISDPALAAQRREINQQPQIDNINIRLSDLREVIKQATDSTTKTNTKKVVTENSRSVEINLEFRHQSNTFVEGLVVHDQNYAERE